MRYIGIEATTDRQYPDVSIVQFRTEQAARRWLDAGRSGLAWPGAAREDLPLSQQNWHRRFRKVYRMPPGFSLRRRDVRRAFDERLRSQGWRGHGEAWAVVIRRYAVAELGSDDDAPGGSERPAPRTGTEAVGVVS